MTSQPVLSPALRILLVLAAAAVVLWSMSQYAAYILSLTFAFLIALVADPLVNWLRRKGANRGVTLLITLVVVYAVLALLALLFIYAGAQFVTTLPAYTERAQQIAAGWQAGLQTLGLDSAGAAALVRQIDPSRPLNWLASLLSSLGSVVGNVVTLLLLTSFLFVDVVLWPGRLQEIARRGHGYAWRLAEFTVDLRQFMVVMTIVGACIGALNSVVFVLFAVPFALLWGVLSGILNFIPFIGFWLALIPPTVLTLLAHGPERALLLAILFIAINAFVQNVIQPRLVLTRLNLTPFTDLVAVTFWPLVLGPLGAIVGIPLTMAVRALILDVDPSLRWLSGLTSSKVPDLPAPDTSETDQ